MKIGIVCYASVGGSGVVATELARELSARGHRVHLISSDPPFRWRGGLPNLVFERVTTPAYPLFNEPQYLLALATAIARIAAQESLDVVHAHYAVPHATAAYLAVRMLEAGGAARPPRTVTTLHGTDITLVGAEPAYRRVVEFSLQQSHAVTAVSESLKADTLRSVGPVGDIAVVPNFLDCEIHRRRPDVAQRRRIAPDEQPIVMHASNFRPVKRVEMVLDVFERVRQERPVRLVLVGDGPDRAPLEARARATPWHADVTFAGEQQDLVPWLSMADVFLLPSSQESFGLAALEAMACEVPVVASRVGGLPEVIADGETGFLCDPDDPGQMAERIGAILADPALARQVGLAAAVAVRTRYCAAAIVPLYERVYESVITPI
jgi:N-acetyl-alpha-D-glucosaminyl L-malate synthase BshA